MHRKFLGVLGATAALLLILGGIIILAHSSTTQYAQVGPSLAKVEPRVLTATENGQKTSFLVLLNDQADLSAAYTMEDQDARGWYVYRTLTEHAARTQAGIRQFLAASGVQYKSFWVANAILCEGGRDLVSALAARPDVRLIEANHESRWVEKPAANMADSGAPQSIEWNVQNIRAPQVWAQGFTGQGMVIAIGDTGMQWDHPALQPHYRGWNGTSGDHNYNWHDAIHDSNDNNPCGNDSQVPCDDFGHGTHTTGTTSGDDGMGNQIGVAPGAKWIGCRNMDEGNGTPARYTECFQFFIAPTDLNNNNPNPALRPHVINNSWVCPPTEGCAPGTLETIVQNTEAAGIFVEASTGNDGPNCSTVEYPPAIYAEAFSTGAYDSGNNLADFSSRGPVTIDGSGRMKPDISAPGVNVRSSYPTNTYAVLSGTSMAGPHVVGTVALLWSAVPSLVRQVDQTKSTLTGSANPNVHLSPQTCGGVSSNQIPNNSFGWGAVDALAATGLSSSSGSLSPASQAFGNQVVNTTSNAKSFTLTSNGGSPLIISSYTFTGADPGDFAQTSNCPGTLNVGSHCTIGVKFTPTALGSRTATLDVNDNAFNSPQTASVSGTGVAPVTLNPTSANYGNVAQGTPSSVHNFTLTNNQTGSLTMGAITTSNSDFQVTTDTCGGTLAGHGHCTIGVTFTPSIIGTENATLTVNENAPAPYNALTASLAGKGVAQVTLTPSSMMFAPQKVGTSSGAKNATLTNNLGTSLPVAISFTGNNPGDYSETDTCSGNVPAHSHCSISVVFKPTATGTRTATLTVTDTANNSPQTVSLTGTGK